MADIKTKEAANKEKWGDRKRDTNTKRSAKQELKSEPIKNIKKKDIKVLDKADNLARTVRTVSIRTKDQIENLSDDGQVTPEEYANDKIKYMAEDAVEDSGRLAGKGAKKTYEGGKKLYKDMRRKRQERQTAEEPIKQTAKSTGKQTAKQVERSVKTQQRNIKTAEKTARQTVKTSKETAKAAVKTAEQTAKASKKAAEAAAKTAQKAAQVAKEAAVKAYQGTVVAVKATIAAIKAISAGIAKLVAAIAAGGSVATLIIVVICFIGLIVGSCFGIFFSNESGTEGRPLSQVVSELNTEFQSSITDIQNRTTYDDFEITSNDGVTAMEKLFFNTNTTTGIGVAKACGVIQLALVQRSLPITEYTPIQVKQTVVGYGKAEKKQVQFMVPKLLGMTETPKPDDAADALAIAITHSHNYKMNLLLKK